MLELKKRQKMTVGKIKGTHYSLGVASGMPTTHMASASV
jgi:hypothetical protein